MPVIEPERDLMAAGRQCWDTETETALGIWAYPWSVDRLDKRMEM